MILSLLALATASAAPFADQVHRTSVDHQGRSLDVTYRADAKVSTRQIGMSAGTRPTTERCLWAARVAVVRDVAGTKGASLSHRLDADQMIRGSHFGKCSENRAQVASLIARRSDEVKAHLAEVAREDAPQLANVISSAKHFAAN
ncbi:hypothetical protein ACLIMP_24990 (plasmid) [Novosphingobium aerophilum]|uniref:hypothetical protein n=1 Tax=Sphingomonadales TaxID=204457 RepID=UPI0026EF50ED|nr:hypothetical protein [Sphingobium yanoikuyae]